MIKFWHLRYTYINDQSAKNKKNKRLSLRLN